MSRSHFRVVARTDGSTPTEVTVSIERGADLFAVRPLRRRRTYELPLSVVARMVVERVLRAEVAARRAERKARRRTRRRS